MAKNSIEAYGAAGKSNVLFFDPDGLTLIVDPNHPLFDRRALLPYDEALVRNIRHHGVLETILIHKDPETGEVIVVDGRRRVIAAREANRRLREAGEVPLMVPALPKRGKKSELAGMMVATNEHREHDSPINRAEKMQRLRDLGYDDEQIAAEFRIEPPTVAASLRLLDCTAAVRDALEADQITVSHALKLAKLTPEQQREKVAAVIAAADGKEGHEKARAQKAALTGDAAPRMRTRKQIAAELAQATGERADALRWVLGLDAGTQDAAAVDPRQLSIDEAA
ncbi:ParB/RepB/Spo0J family partition protein [Burkholderia ambifaria]|uniref:ParB/RepB/Spo0J family partition protein n=1 Tax=Burkholderia ambifaria TaxID=152480 RepID=UPI001B932800|nr:ParB N-terminal domain-containing protein [Burkholderia ambifaria]